MALGVYFRPYSVAWWRDVPYSSTNHASDATQHSISSPELLYRFTVCERHNLGNKPSACQGGNSVSKVAYEQLLQEPEERLSGGHTRKDAGSQEHRLPWPPRLPR